ASIEVGAMKRQSKDWSLAVVFLASKMLPRRNIFDRPYSSQPGLPCTGRLRRYWDQQAGFYDREIAFFEKVLFEPAEIESVVRTRAAGWSALLAPGTRITLVVGVSLAIFQQITGINAVIYYAPTIIQLAGVPSASGAILATAGIGAVNVLLTIMAMLLL